LCLPIILHPPIDIAVMLYWSMGHYTTHPSKSSAAESPSYNAGCQQRSALSAFCAWTTAIFSPSSMYRDQERRVVSSPVVSPSDKILCRMTATGMASRLGVEFRQSQALVQRHIQWNQSFRKQQLHTTVKLVDQYDLTSAICMEIIAWLGWLRASKIFQLRTTDVVLVPPDQHLRYELPTKVGVVLLQLLPSAKSSRNKRVDIVIAWTTSSGLSLGYWLCNLLHLQDHLGYTSNPHS